MMHSRPSSSVTVRAKQHILVQPHGLRKGKIRLKPNSPSARLAWNRFLATAKSTSIIPQSAAQTFVSEGDSYQLMPSQIQ